MTASFAAVGIDFGADSCRVAVASWDGVLLNNVAATQTPSCVAATPAGVLVGQAARDLSSSVIRGVKSCLGVAVKRCPLDVGVTIESDRRRDGPLLRTAHGVFAPEEVAASLLDEMRRKAESCTKQPVTDAAVTVPAYFNAAQRLATLHAGEIAGLKVSLINDTSAAALAFAARVKTTRTAVIMDIGSQGGSASVIVAKRGGFARVLATSSARLPGAQDVDSSMLSHLLKIIKKEYAKDLTHDSDSLELLRDAWNKAKQSLSPRATMTTVHAILPNQKLDFRVLISLNFFERDHCQILLTGIEKCVSAVLQQAKIQPKDVDDVVLLGGCSRIPSVRSAVLALFPVVGELSASVHPDHGVARGAALYAADPSLLEEVMPMKLTFTSGGSSRPLCEPGARLPFVTDIVLFNPESQPAFLISVEQGEIGQIVEKRGIAWITVSGNSLPKTLTIKFHVNIDGTFECVASDSIKLESLVQACLSKSEREILRRPTRADTARSSLSPAMMDAPINNACSPPLDVSGPHASSSALVDACSILDVSDAHTSPSALIDACSHPLDVSDAHTSPSALIDACSPPLDVSDAHTSLSALIDACSHPLDVSDAHTSPSTLIDASSPPLDVSDAHTSPSTLIDACSPPLDVSDAHTSPSALIDACSPPLDVSDAHTSPSTLIDACSPPLDVSDAHTSPSALIDACSHRLDVSDAHTSPSTLIDACSPPLDVSDARTSPSTLIDACSPPLDVSGANISPSALVEACSHLDAFDSCSPPMDTTDQDVTLLSPEPTRVFRSSPSGLDGNSSDPSASATGCSVGLSRFRCNKLHPSPTESSPTPERRSSTESSPTLHETQTGRETLLQSCIVNDIKDREILLALAREFHVHIFTQDLVSRIGAPLRINPLDYSNPALVQYFVLQEDVALQCLADTQLRTIMSEVRSCGRFSLMVDTFLTPARNLVSLMLKYCLTNGDIIERLIVLVNLEECDNLFSMFSELCNEHSVPWERCLCGVSFDFCALAEEPYERLLRQLRQKVPDLRVVWNSAHRLSDVLAQCWGTRGVGRDFLGAIETLRDYFESQKRCAVLYDYCPPPLTPLTTSEDFVKFCDEHLMGVMKALMALTKSDWKSEFLARHLLASLQGLEFKTQLRLLRRVLDLSAGVSLSLQLSELSQDHEASKQVETFIDTLRENATAMVAQVFDELGSDHVVLRAELEQLLMSLGTTLDIHLRGSLCLVRDVNRLARALVTPAPRLESCDLFDWVPDLQRKHLAIEFFSARSEFAVNSRQKVVPSLMASRLLKSCAALPQLYPNLLKGLQELCSLPLLPGGLEVRKLELLQRCLETVKCSAIAPTMILLGAADTTAAIQLLDYEAAVSLLLERCTL